jgi:predicted DCC family thiol-disulfide oxidoreductase YuxK
LLRYRARSAATFSGVTPSLRDSVFWFEPASARGPEQIYVRSTAVLRVLRYLGGVWRPLGLVAAVVPRVVRDWVYDFVARHRHQIIRADASCLLPTPEQRARFIEWETALGKSQ